MLLFLRLGLGFSVKAHLFLLHDPGHCLMVAAALARMHTHTHTHTHGRDDKHSTDKSGLSILDLFTLLPHSPLAVAKLLHTAAPRGAMHSRSAPTFHRTARGSRL